MTTPPNNQLLPAQGPHRTTPKRIATTIGDWTKAGIIVIGYCTALMAAVTASYIALKVLLFVVDLAQQALFPGG